MSELNDAPYNIIIKVGADKNIGFVTHLPSATDSQLPGALFTLAGCSFRMQVRKKVGQPVLLEATTSNGKIVVDEPTSRVDIHFTAADTDLVTERSGVYDVEMVMADGEVKRIMQGGVIFDPNVTRTP